MLLNDISLYLDVDEFERMYRSQFEFRNRYLCNFLRRRLKTLRLRTQGFNQVLIKGCRVAEECCPVTSEHSAIASLAFDRTRYDTLGPEEHHEFFISMLLEGLEKCARYHRIPLANMKGWIEEFRRGGYRNEWTHKEKLLRPLGLRAALLCKLDSEKFVLTLKLERKGSIVFQEPILETKPDELCFAYEFKDIVVQDDTVVVTSKYTTDKYGKPIIFSLNVNSLA